jgi:hypothetical protein
VQQPFALGVLAELANQLLDKTRDRIGNGVGSAIAPLCHPVPPAAPGQQ